MPATPDANVSRQLFDASKAYCMVEMQQGVPLTDAELNEMQHVSRWMQGRALDAILGFDTTQPSVAAGLYKLVQIVDPSKVWPADAPAVADTPESWFPGSMRPWIATGDTKTNDYNIMWGPAWVQGLFVEDFDQRGAAGLYSDPAHVITRGVLTAVGGLIITDASKDFLPAMGNLHLNALAGGVGNGQNARARVRFDSGAEAGNIYEISGIPSSNQLTLTGPYSAGGPAIGDDYSVLPNAISLSAGIDYAVWLCTWSEDIDGEEDTDLPDPMMAIEGSHRQRLRYWHRVFRDGATQPTAASRPDYADTAPQLHDNRVYWEKVAVINVALANTLADPSEIVYATPGHFEFPSFTGMMRTMTISEEVAGDQFRGRFSIALSSTDAQAHRFSFDLFDLDGSGSSSYILDLVRPNSSPDAFSGLRIGGPSSAAANFTGMGQTALQVVSGDVIFGSIGSPKFLYDESATKFTLKGDLEISKTGGALVSLAGRNFDYDFLNGAAGAEIELRSTGNAAEGRLRLQLDPAGGGTAKAILENTNIEVYDGIGGTSVLEYRQNVGQLLIWNLSLGVTLNAHVAPASPNTYDISDFRDIAASRDLIFAGAVKMATMSPGTQRWWSSGNGKGLAPFAQAAAPTPADISIATSSIAYGVAASSLLFRVPLNLPHGVKIDAITVMSRTDSGSGSNEVLVELKQQGRTTGTPGTTTLFSISNTIRDGNPTDITDTGSHIVDNENDWMWLEVTLNNGTGTGTAFIRDILVSYRSNKLYDDGLDF